MKTFRDERHGFEIDIPDEWSAPKGEFVGIRLEGDLQFGFQLPPNEAFNIVAGSLNPEHSLEQTRKEFKRYASEKGYKHLYVGEITVLGKQHIWARYLKGSSHWTKKYLIVFVGIEYDFTFTTTVPAMLSAYEDVWDRVVASFRLINPVREFPEDSYIQQHGKLLGTYYGETNPQPPDVGFHPLKPPASSRVAAIYRRAYNAVTEGKYSAAQALLAECLRLDPEFTLAYKEKAVVYEVLGDNHAVIEHRLQVKRLDPSDLTNRYKLALALFHVRNWDEALEEARHLVKVAPHEARFSQLVSLTENQRSLI